MYFSLPARAVIGAASLAAIVGVLALPAVCDVVSARAAQEAAIPASGSIASCAVESKARVTGAWNPPRVTCKDVVVFLREAKAVSKDVWLHDYSHVGMADHTGTITLNTGEKIRWLIRPGGLGQLTLQDGTELFLVRCCAK